MAALFVAILSPVCTLAKLFVPAKVLLRPSSQTAQRKTYSVFFPQLLLSQNKKTASHNQGLVATRATNFLLRYKYHTTGLKMLRGISAARRPSCAKSMAYSIAT
jgi:hypothetical protein